MKACSNPRCEAELDDTERTCCSCGAFQVSGSVADSARRVKEMYEPGVKS